MPGGTAREVIKRWSPFGVRTIAITRQGRKVGGADVLPCADELDALLGNSDVVVLAAPLTPGTRALIGRREFDLICADGWLMNVGRGALVRTGDLVVALNEGGLRGACLNVAEPEPLEAGHELWAMPSVLITLRTANMVQVDEGGDYRLAAYASLVRDNVERFITGRPLVGLVDPLLGY